MFSFLPGQMHVRFEGGQKRLSEEDEILWQAHRELSRECSEFLLLLMQWQIRLDYS